MLSEVKSVKTILTGKPRKIVYRKPPLTESQRAAYYGLNMFSIESEGAPTESSISSFTMAQSALDLFNQTMKTTTTDEEEEPSIQKRLAVCPNESSISSFTIAQSALDLFNQTKKTTTNEILKDSTDEPMEVDDPPLTPKRISHGRQETSRSIFSEHPKEKEPVAAPSKPHQVGSRLNLLLPRFMQSTTASNARASTQPVSCASPRCRKKSSPLTFSPQQMEVCQEANSNHQSNQNARFTPKKSVAIVRRIADQSFNAAKLPILNWSNYEGIPRAEPVKDFSIEDKRAPLITPQPSKMSSTPAAYKERFNQTGALLQEEDDRMETYDNDVGNFSALNIDSDAHEEQDNDAGNVSPFSNQDEDEESNESLIKIVAGLKKNQKQKSFCLAKKKIIKPETPPYYQQDLRRSRRNRVHTLRRDLGQEPVYEYDENGLPTLVDVTDVEIKDPRAIKYLAVDKAEQNQKERELKKRQKTRKEFAKQQREREKELEF